MLVRFGAQESPDVSASRAGPGTARKLGRDRRGISSVVVVVVVVVVVAIVVLGVLYVVGDVSPSGGGSNKTACATGAGSISVTFSSSGLPTGTAWSVTLNGTTKNSTTTTIAFAEPPGSYSFEVTAPGYAPSPATGTVTLCSTAVVESVVFTGAGTDEFPVVFTETGLAVGTNWSITLAGRAQSTTTTSITFSEPNGTFGFTVMPLTGYSAAPASGSVVVQGTAAAQTIAFSTPLSAIFSFGTAIDQYTNATQPYWEWTLTYHVNLTGQVITLGDMVFNVSGNGVSGAINITAYDTGTQANAGVWAFPGPWMYAAGYGATTQVGNQFDFDLFGSESLTGIVVTLSCPGTPYTGSVSVTVTD
jgi:hypothetical protein